MQIFNKTVIIVLPIFFLLISCNENSKKQGIESSKEYIKASIGEENEFPYSDYISDYELIPLETSKDALIGQIQTIIFKGGMFYIKCFNDDRILIFDKNGKYFKTIDFKGKGPGEYLQIVDFAVNNSSIEIFDQRKIIKYSVSGEFIDESKVCENDNFNPISFIVTPSGKKVYWNLSYSKNSKNSNRRKIFLFDKKCRQEFEYGNILYDDYFSKRFYDNGNSILIEPSKFDYDILSIENDKLIKRYTIDFGSKSIPQELLSESYIKKNEDQITEKIVDLSVFWDVHYPIETEKYLSFMATLGNKDFQFFYDKIKKKCYNISWKKNNLTYPWRIKGAIDNNFFSTIDPLYLANYMKIISSDERDRILTKLGSYKLSPTDNQIIICWHSK